MSDPQCPARVLVVRHAEAAYERSDVLSDEGGWLTDRGQQQARALVERLRTEKVAVVYTSRLGRAVQTGSILADGLGVETSPIDGVQEYSVGDLVGRSHTDPEARRIFLAWLAGDLSVRTPGAETGDEVVSRFACAVDEIADRHRGETVVVVSHGGVMSLAIPQTAANVSGGLRRCNLLDNCSVVPVEVDGDGWRLVGEWPERRWDGATRDLDASEEA